MESDKHLYEIFEVNPEWLFELTERRSPGPSRFVSVTVKAIERRSDGVLIPEALAEPILVAELQMQFDKEIYGRIVVEMAIVQTEHAGRGIEGIIIFGTRELDPCTEPWIQVVSTYYLDELLEKLTVRSPNHPLAAVFQPLVEKDRELLEANAATYYNQIKTYLSECRQRDKLQSVFIDWMMQRFSELGKQEIESMLLGNLPNLCDTQSGKDLIAIGVQEGIEKGIERGIEKGIEKGIERGTLIGTIRTCRIVLGMEPLEERELTSKPAEELETLAKDLQCRVLARFGTK